MSDRAIDAAVTAALEAGEGLLRLAPTWVPRSFLMPGRRIKLAPQDLYASGAHRGGIDRRAEDRAHQRDLANGQRPLAAGRAGIGRRAQGAVPGASTCKGPVIVRPPEKNSVSSAVSPGFSDLETPNSMTCLPPGAKTAWPPAGATTCVTGAIDDMPFMVMLWCISADRASGDDTASRIAPRSPP